MNTEDKNLTPRRNDLGYPLLENGSIDWELTSIEKSKAQFGEDRKERRKIRKPAPTNITPKKKKRKK